MSSIDARWAELSSQNERIIRAGEPRSAALGQAGSADSAATPQWAELSSQGERLAGAADQLARPASSRPCGTDLRLVAGAA
jgi:hypothetical protein